MRRGRKFRRRAGNWIVDPIRFAFRCPTSLLCGVRAHLRNKAALVKVQEQGRVVLRVHPKRPSGGTIVPHKGEGVAVSSREVLTRLRGGGNSFRRHPSGHIVPRVRGKKGSGEAPKGLRKEGEGGAGKPGLKFHPSRHIQMFCAPLGIYVACRMNTAYDAPEGENERCAFWGATHMLSEAPFERG